MGDHGAIAAAPEAAMTVEMASRPAGLVLLMALNFLDVFSTGKALAAGGHESNPLAAWVLSSGLSGLLLGKALLLSIVVGLVLLPHRRTDRVARAIWRSVLLYGAVVIWNCAQVMVRGLR